MWCDSSDQPGQGNDNEKGESSRGRVGDGSTNAHQRDDYQQC